MKCVKIFLLCSLFVFGLRICNSQIQLYVSSGGEYTKFNTELSMWGYGITESNNYSPVVRFGVGCYLSKSLVIKWLFQGSFKKVGARDRGSSPLKELVFSKYTYSILATKTLTKYLNVSLGPFVYDIPSMKQVELSGQEISVKYDGTLFGVLGSVEANYRNFNMSVSYEYPIEGLSSKQYWSGAFIDPIKSWQFTLGYAITIQRGRRR